MKNVLKKINFKRSFLILSVLTITILSIHLTTKSSYTKYGTKYGKTVIKAYETSRFYPFITQFLTPYFMPELKNLDGKKILDAGCGVGLWSIQAARNGGDVYAIDIQPGMIKQAKNIINKESVKDKIHLKIGDVSNLPYQDNFFDKAISINVACNLPKQSFNNHFKELNRVLKKGGIAIVAVPASHEVLFSNRSKPIRKIRENINVMLKSLGRSPSIKQLKNAINNLEGVLSATFINKNNRLSLVTNKNQLKSGEKIWRKLPNIVIPNFFYEEQDFLRAFKKATLHVEKTFHPKFISEEERLNYNDKVHANSRLDQNYVKHEPFVIYYLRKVK